MVAILGATIFSLFAILYSYLMNQNSALFMSNLI